jgi:hypothetical protein
MVERVNMSRPRIRLVEGADPHGPLEAIYNASQLDFPKGAVRINRHGQLTGGPTGFTGTGPNNQANQFPEDKHGKSYDDDTGNNWVRGFGPKQAEGKPYFDAVGAPKGPKDLRNSATGSDANKSPFSAAHLSKERGRPDHHGGTGKTASKAILNYERGKR